MSRRKHGKVHNILCTNQERKWKRQHTNKITVTYKIKFIDSVSFMSSSLSSLADNLAEGLYKETCKDCKSDLKCVVVKDSVTVNCVDCNKDYEK